MLTFYLNGQLIEESEPNANLTLLRYLRTYRSLPGTKEGCGSGDCGACTVLVGTINPHSNQWQYKSVNACITLLTQVAGKSVITVEALSNGKDLHPAQQAMVELHGSQCGFCTPGFVMSMAGLYEQQERNNKQSNITRHDIEIALSGNLCRCTGYRPIIEAAEAMFDSERFSHQHAVHTWQPANQISNTEHQGLVSKGSHSWVPTSEASLQTLLNENPDARLVAGATDLALEITQRQHTINKIISVNHIDSLKTVDMGSDTITIGAACTYDTVEPLFNKLYPEFGNMLERLGSRQVRNSGTIGGNIANASPIGDTPPVLIALGATITLASSAGTRTIPLEAFFINYKVTDLEPSEYIQAIHIPRLKDNEQLKVYKISKRLEDDISAVLFAAKISIDKNQTITAIKTGFGGMAAIPKASHHIETYLQGKQVNEANFASAAELIRKDFQPIDDVRASANYRLRVAQGLLKKCAIELTNPNTTTRIERIRTVEVKHA